MKAAVVLGVLLSVLQVFAQQGRPPSGVGQACIDELHLNKDEIDKVFKTDSVFYLPEDDLNFSEYLGCYWKKTGYIDENGVFNYVRLTHLLKNFPKSRFGVTTSGNIGLELARAGIESCKSNPPSDTVGETAVKLQNCVTRYFVEYLKNNP